MFYVMFVVDTNRVRLERRKLVDREIMFSCCVAIKTRYRNCFHFCFRFRFRVAETKCFHLVSAASPCRPCPCLCSCPSPFPCPSPCPCPCLCPSIFVSLSLSLSPGLKGPSKICPSPMAIFCNVSSVEFCRSELVEENKNKIKNSLLFSFARAVGPAGANSPP